MRRRRPNRMAASLPRTLASVPSSPNSVSVSAGRQSGAGSPGGHGDKTKERDAPSAQRAHFERVDAIGDGIGHGRAVAQHRAKIKNRGVLFRRRRPRMRGDRKRHQDPRATRAHRRRDECQAPAADGGEEIGAGKRQRAGNPDAGGVARGRARQQRAVDLVGEQLQPGHVGAGPTDAGERAGRECGPEAVGEGRKQRMPGDREGDTAEVDPLGVDAVGQRHEHRHRDDVRGIEDRGDPSGFAVGQRPARHHLRQQRGPEERADLDEDLRRANEGDRSNRRCAINFVHVCVPAAVRPWQV